MSFLSRPVGSCGVPSDTLAYFRERQRNRIYDSVLREFLRSKISKADLARRMGKRPEVVTRLLGAPGNWTLDTVSDLMFAISGSEFEFRVVYPLSAPPRNDTAPDWLIGAASSTQSANVAGSAVGAVSDSDEKRHPALGGNGFVVGINQEQLTRSQANVLLGGCFS